MEKEILKYYSKFKEIYNEENYPEWFKFFELYNQEKGYGDKGYKDKEKGHELGHYAILQTPVPELQKIPKKTKIVMVGKNNSWFDGNDMEKALKIVKNLENGIPEDDYYLEGKSNFSARLKALIKQIGFKNKKAEDLLNNHRIGMNRIWLQTGTSSKNIEKMEEQRQGISFKEILEGGTSLVDKCSQWTEEIIDIIDPELVLIFGSGKHGADKLFNKQEGKLEREKASFVVKHCYHPTASVLNDTKIEIILEGFDEAELLND